ncbi:MAG: hypothetical protein A2163_00825 [Actinobacteria bacterium RBG_13_35_12]|nr:MAG: hypothetical protein A2163_00825 [Actinobacteria bacterium RBG_13_35_12]
MIRDCKIGHNVKIHNPGLVNLYECEIGDNCMIGAFVEIGRGVKIGNNCKIQTGCFLCEGVTLEDNVFIAPHVCFTNDPYPPSGKDNWLPILIKTGAGIGANSTIRPGVTIGENSLIGMGSVVTKDILAGRIAWGNPARDRGINIYREHDLCLKNCMMN